MLNQFNAMKALVVSLSKHYCQMIPHKHRESMKKIVSKYKIQTKK
jgi:endonuclease III-like uncharacterized protein